MADVIHEQLASKTSDKIEETIKYLYDNLVETLNDWKKARDTIDEKCVPALIAALLDEASGLNKPEQFDNDKYIREALYLREKLETLNKRTAELFMDTSMPNSTRISELITATNNFFADLDIIMQEPLLHGNFFFLLLTVVRFEN